METITLPGLSMNAFETAEKWASNGTGIYGSTLTTGSNGYGSITTPSKAITTSTAFVSTDNSYWNPITYYNTYPYWTSYQPNKLEMAFKLVQKLIDKKFIKEPKTVGDFIELVNEVTTIV